MEIMRICLNRDFVFNSGIGDIAMAIMGSPYSVFYHEHVLNKEPGCFIHNFEREKEIVGERGLERERGRERKRE